MTYWDSFELFIKEWCLSDFILAKYQNGLSLGLSAIGENGVNSNSIRTTPVLIQVLFVVVLSFFIFKLFFQKYFLFHISCLNFKILKMG